MIMAATGDVFVLCCVLLVTPSLTRCVVLSHAVPFCDLCCSGILPVLKPIFEQADGEVLLALVKHLAVFYNLMPRWVLNQVGG
jgi:hypothetical protein